MTHPLNEVIRQWGERHNLKLSDVDLKAAFEDAETLRAQQAWWQPIETAPKVEDVSVQLWVPTRYAKYTKFISCTGRYMNGFWVIVNADEAIQRVEPTLWQPLPQPVAGG